jgi:hypothetical protein
MKGRVAVGERVGEGKGRGAGGEGREEERRSFVEALELD